MGADRVVVRFLKPADSRLVFPQPRMPAGLSSNLLQAFAGRVVLVARPFGKVADDAGPDEVGD